MVNTLKLKGKIAENGITIKSLAEEVGVAPYTLGRKLRGEKDMTLKEAEKIQKVLNIPDDSFVEYFFCA